MKEKLYDIIFGTTSKSGKIFDLILLFLILCSVTIILFESVPEWNGLYEKQLYYLEWGFTIIFTIEYFLRIFISKRPLKYILSWWGIIDLVSILPSFISPFFSGSSSLRVIRAVRLLRIFRILKLSRFTSESQALAYSLKASYYKITIFLFFVVMMMIMTGTLMYVIEGGSEGFESIPSSIYWAIVTTTTVGYGDIVPVTDLGKALSSIMMILGYAILAVPTGIVTAEALKADKPKSFSTCKRCKTGSLTADANFCHKCGMSLEEE